MSIVVSDLKLPYESTEADALKAALAQAGAGGESLGGWKISRLSYDLRRGNLNKVWAVELELGAFEARILQRNVRNIRAGVRVHMPAACGHAALKAPPVVVGFGPAGLFCALVLAENGFCPHVIERGGAMDDRDSAVERFNKTGELCADSNIQFGEGGAGAYSDGKLTTRINDSRCALALRLLREHGAPERALYAAKPHIGTDLLKSIVVSMRERIVRLGGSVSFNTRLEGLDISSGVLRAVNTSLGQIECQTAVLAIGHSARDTFEALHTQGVIMQQKAFSAGVRIEHPQSQINEALYGRFAGTKGLPPGEYLLSHSANGRGCYSFCMCPGGVVAAAASEQEGVVTNGMSYHARDLENANSALCVSVNPADCGAGLFSGAEFQRTLERAAFKLGGGDFVAPAQRLGAFLSGKAVNNGAVIPSYERGVRFADLRALLPAFIADTIALSIPEFAKKIRGFDRDDAVLTGVETRTSSPVRILRGDNMNSTNVRGLIPCGEGAGYAGGIMSAACDGIRAAEQILSEYASVD